MLVLVTVVADDIVNEGGEDEEVKDKAQRDVLIIKISARVQVIRNKPSSPELRASYAGVESSGGASAVFNRRGASFYYIDSSAIG